MKDIGTVLAVVFGMVLVFFVFSGALAETLNTRDEAWFIATLVNFGLFCLGLILMIIGSVIEKYK